MASATTSSAKGPNRGASGGDKTKEAVAAPVSITAESLKRAARKAVESDESLAAELRAGTLKLKQLRSKLAQMLGLTEESALKPHKDVIIECVFELKEELERKSGEESNNDDEPADAPGEESEDKDDESEDQSEEDVDDEEEEDDDDQDFEHQDDPLFENLPESYLDRILDVVWVKQKSFKPWPSLIYDPRWVEGDLNRVAMKHLGKKHLVLFYAMTQSERFGFAEESDIVEWAPGFRKKLDKNASSFKPKKYAIAFPKAIEEARADYNKPKAERGELQHLSMQTKKKRKPKKSQDQSPQRQQQKPARRPTDGKKDEQGVKREGKEEEDGRREKKEEHDEENDDEDEEDHEEEREEQEDEAEEEADDEDEDFEQEDEAAAKPTKRKRTTKKDVDAAKAKRSRKATTGDAKPVAKRKQGDESSSSGTKRKARPLSKKQEEEAAAAAAEERRRRLEAARQSGVPVWKTLASGAPLTAVAAPELSDSDTVTAAEKELSNAIHGEKVVDIAKAKAAVDKLSPHTAAIIRNIDTLRHVADLLKVCTKSTDDSIAAAAKTLRGALKRLHKASAIIPPTTKNQGAASPKSPPPSEPLKKKRGEESSGRVDDAGDKKPAAKAEPADSKPADSKPPVLPSLNSKYTDLRKPTLIPRKSVGAGAAPAQKKKSEPVDPLAAAFGQ